MYTMQIPDLGNIKAHHNPESNMLLQLLVLLSMLHACDQIKYFDGDIVVMPCWTTGFLSVLA